MRIEVQLITRIRDPGDLAVDRSKCRTSYSTTVSAYTRETAIRKALPQLIKRLESASIDISKPHIDVKPRPKPVTPAPPHTHIAEKRLQMSTPKSAPKVPSAGRTIPKAPPMEERAPVNPEYLGVPVKRTQTRTRVQVRGDGQARLRQATVEVDPFDDLEVA